jgi:threonine aldolase
MNSYIHRLFLILFLGNAMIQPCNNKSFASDNHAGIHPDILQAINAANKGHAMAYGADEYTKKALELFKNEFGADCDVYFVGTGTAGNVLGLQTLLKSHQAIICASSAHINTSEYGATENHTGSKLLCIPSKDGKLTVDAIKDLLSTLNPQRVLPKVIVITQVTEFGTLYTLSEIKEITDFAHTHDMYVYMDGARLSNAVAALNTSLIDITKNVGIDALCFGGTKNGMMLGEAVIFFNKTLSKDFNYIRLQGTHLFSKMRFISAQFIALLSNNLWLKNAQHANAMAQFLADSLKGIPSVTISKKVEANAVFAYIDPKFIPLMQEKYFFHVWDETTSEVRLMTAWDTTQDDILDFIAHIKEITKATRNEKN